MEDIVAENDLSCENLAQGISEDNNVSVLPRDWFCDILMKNVAAFCTGSKSLPAAKVKILRFIVLSKKISEYPGLISVVLLLNFKFMKSI